MARVVVVKNFASKAECGLLNDWVFSAIKNGSMGPGFTDPGGLTEKRFTTRMYGDRFKYPEIALQIHHKTRKFWGIEDSPKPGFHGRDGIVVSSTYADGDVYEHVDGRLHPTLHTLRCNLLSQAADSGCDMYVGGKKIEAATGDLVCYVVTLTPHYVTKNLGTTPRNLWMFGSLVLLGDWENGDIQPKVL